jgi:hypothetical protein
MKIFLLLLFSVGCVSTSQAPSKAVEATQGQAYAKTESIRTKLSAVDVIVEKAIQEDDTSGLPAVKPHTDQARTDSIVVDSMVLDLVNLLTAKEKELAEVKKELAELKDKNSFKHKLPWILGGLGALCVGIGLFLNVHKCTVIGLIIGGSSFGVIKYYSYLEVILPAMIIVCICFIIGAWRVHHQEKKLE